MEKQIILSCAPKLGIQSDQITRKAEEFVRIVDVRSGSSSLAALGLNGSCKAVMCLDLAATSCGQPVDRASAVRLSGMNRKLYSSGVKAMERLLDLQQANTSLPELAVQFGCPSAKMPALQLLQSYEKQHGGDLAEYSRALFNSAALYTVCKKQKIKIDKTKMVEQAGVKRTTFDRLVGQMNDIASKLSTEEETTKKTRTGKTFLDELNLQEHDSGAAESSRDEATEDDLEEEPYTVWKTRILTQAYKSLGKTYSVKS